MLLKVINFIVILIVYQYFAIKKGASNGCAFYIHVCQILNLEVPYYPWKDKLAPRNSKPTEIAVT